MISVTICGINQQTKQAVKDREVYLNPAHISILEPYQGEFSETIKTIVKLTNGETLGISESLKYMRDQYEVVTKQQFVGTFKY